MSGIPPRLELSDEVLQLIHVAFACLVEHDEVMVPDAVQAPVQDLVLVKKARVLQRRVAGVAGRLHFFHDRLEEVGDMLLGQPAIVLNDVSFVRTAGVADLQRPILKLQDRVDELLAKEGVLVFGPEVREDQPSRLRPQEDLEAEEPEWFGALSERMGLEQDLQYLLEVFEVERLEEGVQEKLQDLAVAVLDRVVDGELTPRSGPLRVLGGD